MGKAQSSPSHTGTIISPCCTRYTPTTGSIYGYTHTHKVADRSLLTATAHLNGHGSVEHTPRNVCKAITYAAPRRTQQVTDTCSASAKHGRLEVPRSQDQLLDRLKVQRAPRAACGQPSDTGRPQAGSHLGRRVDFFAGSRRRSAMVAIVAVTVLCLTISARRRSLASRWGHGHHLRPSRRRGRGGGPQRGAGAAG